MKLVTLIFLFTIAFGYSQKKMNVFYGVIYNKTPLSEDFKMNYPKEYAKELEREKRVKELQFTLRIDGNKSIFYHPKVDKNDQPLFFALQNTDGEHIYYTDLKAKKHREYFPYWGSKFNIEYPLNKIPWKLTEESKKINSYTCFKATKQYVQSLGGKDHAIDVEAWYAPEIPLKFGPKQYDGLPGLIIELKENHLTYYLKSIDYNPKNQKEIVPPKKGTKMTWDEFAQKSTDIKKRAKQAIINGRG